MYSFISGVSLKTSAGSMGSVDGAKLASSKKLGAAATNCCVSGLAQAPSTSGMARQARRSRRAGPAARADDRRWNMMTSSPRRRRIRARHKRTMRVSRTLASLERTLEAFLDQLGRAQQRTRLGLRLAPFHLRDRICHDAGRGLDI